MKKKLLVTGAIALMAIGSTQASADSSWIVKGSIDGFDIGTDSQVPVISGATGTTGTTEIDGTLVGGTFYLGKMYGPPEAKKVTMLEFSLRSGDLDYSSHVTASQGQYNISGIMDRSDIEVKISHTWVKGKFQPFVNIGYWGINEDTTQNLQDGWIWIAENNSTRKVEKSIDALLANIGFGYSLVKKGGFNMAIKGEAGFNYGKGDFHIVGHSVFDKDDSSFGYQGKANLTFAYSFPIKKNIGQIFADLGYQYQNFSFGEEVGEETFYGPYGRAGFTFIF